MLVEFLSSPFLNNEFRHLIKLLKKNKKKNTKNTKKHKKHTKNIKIKKNKKNSVNHHRQVASPGGRGVNTVPFK